MIIEHEGHAPRIDPSAYVAPNAVVSGDVEIGPDSRILFGAVITDDGGPVRVGSRVTVMENAVVRGRARFPTMIGDHSLVGPHAHLNGTRIGAKVFIATDRPVYRPKQPVKFNVWVRHAKYDQEDISQFADQDFTLRVTNPKGDTVLEKVFHSDKFGGFAGEYELPEGATLGQYGIGRGRLVEDLDAPSPRQRIEPGTV